MLPVEPSVGLVGVLSGGRGALSCRGQRSLAWPSEQSWGGGQLHQAAMWNPSLCLGPWVRFRGSSVFKRFCSQPGHEALSAKGSSWEKQNSLL